MGHFFFFFFNHPVAIFYWSGGNQETLYFQHISFSMCSQLFWVGKRCKESLKNLKANNEIHFCCFRTPSLGYDLWELKILILNKLLCSVNFFPQAKVKKNLFSCCLTNQVLFKCFYAHYMYFSVAGCVIFHYLDLRKFDPPRETLKCFLFCYHYIFK